MGQICMFNKPHNAQHIIFFWYLIVVLGFILPSIAYGGGLYIYEDTLTINNKERPLIFGSGERLNIRYFAQDYSYSGHRGEYGYHVFLISPKISISNSVGNGGANHKNDVKRIQRALIRTGFLTDDADGIVTTKFIEAIYRFQRSIGLSRLMLGYPGLLHLHQKLLAIPWHI